MRAQYLKFHPTCCAPCCLEPATDVDHVVPLRAGGSHAWSNLRAYCHAHHSQRTARDQPGGWATRSTAGVGGFNPGVPVAIGDLSGWYTRATAGADLAIVEGAGGWRVPLHPEGFLSDLPEHLGLGVVLVVGLRLGCLNHARLTLEAIAHSGRCRCVGWIGNSIDRQFARPDENLETLARLLGGPPLAVVPPLPDPTGAAALEFLRRPNLVRALGLFT